MPTITFKVTESQKIELERAAGGQLSEYVRRSIFSQVEDDRMNEVILDQLASLSRQVEGIRSESASSIGPVGSREVIPPPEVMGMMVEILLMLRHALDDKTMRFAQAEVSRIGLPVFSIK